MKRFFYFFITSIFLLILYLENSFSSGLKCDFSQDDRTYNRNLKFDYNREMTPKLSWGLSSSINYISNSQDLLQEDGRIGLNLDYLLTQKLKTAVFFSQNKYFLGKERSTTSDYGVISEFNFAGISLIQILGAKSTETKETTSDETRRSEQGVDYSQTVTFSPRIFSGSVTEISLNHAATRFKNIPIFKRDFSFSFFKYLTDLPTSDSEKDSLQAAYQEAWEKKKLYSGKTQKTNLRAVNLCTSKKVSWGLKLDFTFDFLHNRDREYSADSDSLDLASSQNMYIGVKKKFLQKVLVGSFYKYMRSDWDYEGYERDQKMEVGELGGEVKAEISRADSLYFTASIGVTSFYAPFSGRFNDRDMLTILAWGEYLHVFNSDFNLRVEGGFKNFHQLYMSDSSSYDNNHDQTYLFSPTLIWHPHGKLSFKQNYSIKANYRYYDYQKAMESDRSRLYRRASSTSEVIYRYNQRMIFSLGYTYKYEDHGPIIWKDQWVQKISQDYRTNTISISVDYQPFKKVSFSPKYTHEKRKSWNHEPIDTTGSEGKAGGEKRTLTDKFFQNIISFSFKYSVDKENYVYFSAARRSQNGSGIKQEISDYITISIASVF